MNASAAQIEVNGCELCRTNGSIPPPGELEDWSIGIYAGESPLALSGHPGVANPVLTRADVTDVEALAVADPFMVRVGGVWHMFLEVMNGLTAKGEIALATSPDGLVWQYERVVLSEPFHLSYPHVFEWRGEYYMVPESHQTGSVRLYRATRFPTEWTLAATLVRRPYLADPTIVRFDGRWWLFADVSGHRLHHTLGLFHSAELDGPWAEHPASPVVRDDALASRPAGRIVELDGQLVRFAQGCEPAYGTDVRAFLVTDLSPTAYRERPLVGPPILQAGPAGWNRSGMHHVDPHRLRDGSWIACVDGWRAPG